MPFINPKTDFAFKKIFGSEESKQILISFLNAVLYDGNPTIEDLTILDPYQAPRIRGMKNSYLDIKAKISGGKTVIIEMQVLNVEGFEKRILYNAAKAYSIQLDSGQPYQNLLPVIALTITDFEMFPDIPVPITHFFLKEKDYLLDYCRDDLELVFLELPKFQKELDNLQTLADRWIYFLKNANRLDSIPPLMATVTEIGQAFAIANRASLTRAELDELEHQEFFIYDQQGAITKGYNDGIRQGIQQGMQQGIQQGMQQGIQQGIQQGMQQGMQQGIQQGIQQAAIEIAKKMLNVVDDETLSQTTGLSIEQIRQLRSEVDDRPV